MIAGNYLEQKSHPEEDGFFAFGGISREVVGTAMLSRMFVDASYLESGRRGEFILPSRWRTVCATCVVLLLWFICPSSRLWSQEAAPRLSPSQAYRAALAPFNQARGESDDLTEADTLALKLGMRDAARSCEVLSADQQSFAKDAAEVLALGKICLFGQQFEQARVALVEYLARPEPAEREAALSLLARAFLGLGEPGSALSQVLSLFRDYPYDAQIHLTSEKVIGASQGLDAELNQQTAEICDKQEAFLLPLLASGKFLPGKDGDVSASTLYADALRCATLERDADGSPANDTWVKLREIVRLPVWQNTAELLPMEEALAQAEMVGRPTPLRVLHGHPLKGSAAKVAPALPLAHGRVFLVPFTVWSPGAAAQIRNVALSAHEPAVYAVTSWTANAGGEDTASPQMVAALGKWRLSLPAHVLLLIVPDAELRAFHVGQYPAGIVFRDGYLTFNAPLVDAGAVRVMVHSVLTGAAKP